MNYMVGPFVKTTIGDIGAPDLIGPGDLESPQEIGKNPALVGWFAGFGPWIIGLQAHQPHETPNSFVVDLMLIAP